MTDRMNAEDWRKLEKLAPKLLNALDEYNAKHAQYKPMSKRKRKSAARMKVKR